MHIPDNYLSPTTCGTLIAVMTPIWTVSVLKVKAQIKEKKETIPLLGVAASLAFLIMMFNLPIPGGTTAHAVGGTLLAVLLGPWAACLALSITLLLQALLFGDGGILAFDANAFNMAFIMPFVGYACYLIGRRLHHEKIGLAVGAYVGINLAALVAGIELGLQPLLFHNQQGIPLYCPYGLNIAVPAMLTAHLLIVGWVEAAFTVLVFQFIKKAAPDSIYHAATKNTKVHTKAIYGLLAGLAILSPLGLIASGTAWGEWNKTELQQRLQTAHLATHAPSGISHGLHFNALFNNYTIRGVPLPIGYILSAVTVLLIFFLFVRVIHYDQNKES
ncbi:cobalt transporter CbiM [Loigolactobacillus backii]|uniref:cobalt transporter CbiM n=1 Tax=Loigolactobacillus backii TaxID=375175 RepID=UPI0007F0D447|nr:cobalt transporter CbiM [Loigolactobacillus backii]ANK60551.1 cobalamin biosynthesis protein CbiM [Loigolactobacillus backii]ANK67976.1 cobalamin biosynthesis protein CbiM [Loigolactobacillus backii]OLF68842.1 cobalamin biosynthesis protein CbiM [Loigolactobacillus backii]PIO86805.1 cobalamin biosynthesis protein CbiM [Loigolactobacillus backii]